MNETQNEEQLRFPDDIMEEGGNLAGRIEAILFVAGEAVRVEDLSKALDVPIREVEDALIHLRDEYDFNQRGFSLKRYGHQVQLATRALYSQDVVRLFQPVQKQSRRSFRRLRWSRWRLLLIFSLPRRPMWSRFAV